ncbi:MAG: acyltransferase family protein [Cyanophyceae cyanobacterium]
MLIAYLELRELIPIRKSNRRLDELGERARGKGEREAQQFFPLEPPIVGSFGNYLTTFGKWYNLKLMYPKNTFYISSLTPLRGFAALFVVMHHYVHTAVSTPQVQNSFQPQLFERIALKGYLWVDFFFLLSGFVIFHVYRNSLYKGTSRTISWRSYWKFIKLRFIRIYPLHIFTLLILVAYQGIIFFVEPDYFFTGYFSFKKLVSNLLLLNAMGLHDSSGWNFVSWSIGAEFYTYLLFPVFLLILHEGSFKKVVWTLRATWAGLYALILVSSQKSLALTHEYGFYRCLLEFLAGIALYHIYDRKWLKFLLAKDSAFLLSFLCLALIFTSGKNDIWVLPCFALLLLAAALNKGRCRKVLNLKPCQFLGEISYSLYMIHGIIVIFMGSASVVSNGQYFWSGLSQLQLWLGLLSFMLLSLLLASITCFKIENPLREYLRKKLVGSSKAVAVRS